MRVGGARARILLACVVIAGSLGATAWAYITRDVRRARGLLEEIEGELATEDAREPARRAALRASPGGASLTPHELALVQNLCRGLEDDRSRHDAVASIRSALAGDRALLLGNPSSSDLRRIVRAFSHEARQAKPALEGMRIALDLWRLQHDLGRAHGPKSAEARPATDPCMLVEDLVDGLDPAACDVVLGELEILIATRPAPAPLLRRAGLEVERQLLVEGLSRPIGESGARRLIADVEAVRTLVARTCKVADDGALKLVRIELDLAELRAGIQETKAIEGKSRRRRSADSTLPESPPAPEVRAAGELRTTLAPWLADLNALRVTRIAVLAKRFKLARGAWPGGLGELRERGADERRDPLPEEPVTFHETSDGRLSIRASTYGDAWIVLLP